MKKYLNFTTVLLLTIFFFSCKKDNGTNNSSTELPVITTTIITNITQSSATTGGNVSSEGTSPVTFRGVCWSRHKTPTISDNKLLNGIGKGSFVSLLTGLTDGATYYARAYATNSSGTAYGDEKYFYVLVLGEAYQGGKLAYILVEGDPAYEAEIPHGIIAASLGATDIKLSWGTNTATGAIAAALGKGRDNTNTIVSVQGTIAKAAKYCDDLVSGGHSDWYLPSKDELYKLYLSRNEVGNYVNTNYYWSSTEATTEAWIQSFITGAKSTYSKSAEFYVRPIRNF
jgi:Protein of unknown function (DUF1566)